MRRALIVLAAVLAAAPATASAKEVKSVVACGASECRGITGRDARRSFEQGAEAQAPARPEPFYSVTVYVDTGAGHSDGWTLRFLPKAGLLRFQDEFGVVGWTAPSPAFLKALRRQTFGMAPKPTVRLGPLTEPTPHEARVVETYAPAAAAGERAATGGGGGGFPWWVLAVAAAAALLGTVLLHAVLPASGRRSARVRQREPARRRAG